MKSDEAVTHKEDGLGTAKRVFYTLSDDQSGKRAEKLLGLLVARLEARGVLTGGDVDKLLAICADVADEDVEA